MAKGKSPTTHVRKMVLSHGMSSSAAHVLYSLVYHRHEHNQSCKTPCPHHTGQCHPGRELIAAETKLSTRTVSTALRELMEGFYISVRRRGLDKGKRGQYFYGIKGLVPWFPLDAVPVKPDEFTKYANKSHPRWKKNPGEKFSPAPGEIKAAPGEKSSPAQGKNFPPNLQSSIFNESSIGTLNGEAPEDSPTDNQDGSSLEKKETTTPGEEFSPGPDEIAAGKAMLAALKAIPDYGEPS